MFATERVGFVSATLQRHPDGEALVLITDYQSLADDAYVEDYRVGARIGSATIREAMQRVLDSGRGAFHVHAHMGRGVPGLSAVDADSLPPLVKSLRAVGLEQAHGILLLSDDVAAAWVWLPGESAPIVPDMLTISGRPMLFVPRPGWPDRDATGRYDRQSFLGSHAQDVIEMARVGIVGIGGGGSHIVQQLAHLGFRHIRSFDGDVVEDTNLNRLIGATTRDAEETTLKVEVARRMIDGLVPGNAFIGHIGGWQERPDLLAQCDIVIGCVDTFAARRDLEAACRRALIPYIDIGMDVHCAGDDPPRLAGQVILSMFGAPCMHCTGFLTEEKLAREAALYGDAGGRPQVVFANGVLASTAVGLAVDVLTGWSGTSDPVVFLSFDGNRGTLAPDPRLAYLPETPCPHYPISQAGSATWSPASIARPDRSAR